ncbi:hypothetical protein EOA24_37385, partial [Mesorhizobium sp. M2A.F.Ca.ET.039.01.1.1]
MALPPTTWPSTRVFRPSTPRGPRVEWRIETTDGVAVPFAAIHSHSVSNPDSDGKPIEVLVVAKVAQPKKHEGCTVGLVLAAGNAQAN